MTTSLTGNGASDMANTAYANARQARSHAAHLDGNPNDAAAAKRWHQVADALFDAAALIDTMQIKGN